VPVLANDLDHLLDDLVGTDQLDPDVGCEELHLVLDDGEALLLPLMPHAIGDVLTVM